MGGGGSSAASSTSLPTADPIEKPKPKRTGKGGGMKLGKNKNTMDSFVSQLESEGVHVTSSNKNLKETSKVASTPAALERIYIITTIPGYNIAAIFDPEDFL